jgi:hypothetical protein
MRRFVRSGSQAPGCQFVVLFSAFILLFISIYFNLLGTYYSKRTEIGGYSHAFELHEVGTMPLLHKYHIIAICFVYIYHMYVIIYIYIFMYIYIYIYVHKYHIIVSCLIYIYTYAYCVIFKT